MIRSTVFPVRFSLNMGNRAAEKNHDVPPISTLTELCQDRWSWSCLDMWSTSRIHSVLQIQAVNVKLQQDRVTAAQSLCGWDRFPQVQLRGLNMKQHVGFSHLRARRCDLSVLTTTRQSSETVFYSDRNKVISLSALTTDIYRDLWPFTVFMDVFYCCSLMCVLPDISINR